MAPLGRSVTARALHPDLGGFFKEDQVLYVDRGVIKKVPPALQLAGKWSGMIAFWPAPEN